MTICCSENLKMPNVNEMDEVLLLSSFPKQHFVFVQKKFIILNSTVGTQRKDLLLNDENEEKTVIGKVETKSQVYKVTCWTLWRYTFSTCQEM